MNFTKQAVPNCNFMVGFGVCVVCVSPAARNGPMPTRLFFADAPFFGSKKGRWVHLDFNFYFNLELKFNFDILNFNFDILNFNFELQL